MKLNGTFTGKLLTCAAALLISSFVADLQAETMKEGKAKVRQIKGSAKYTAEAGGWTPLKVGTVLKSGATIQTAAESLVDLDLGDNGPLIRITPNSTVSLDKLSIAGAGMDAVIDTRLNVQNGTLIGNVKKLAKGSKYEIKTPNGVAGIRGTDYVVTVKKRPDGTYEVTFTDVTGTLVVVALVNGNPETVVLNPGESWTPGSDVRPTPAQLLEFYREQIAQLIKALTPPGNLPPAIANAEQFVSPTIGPPFVPRPSEGESGGD